MHCLCERQNCLYFNIFSTMLQHNYSNEVHINLSELNIILRTKWFELCKGQSHESSSTNCHNHAFHANSDKKLRKIDMYKLIYHFDVNAYSSD